VSDTIFRMKNLITTLLSTALLLISGTFLNAQTNICLGDDITVCTGSIVNIDNCTPGGGTAAQGILLNTPAQVFLTDDSYSAPVNIGFNFNFYGNTYNQLTIGSNCILSFDLALANGYCPWAMGGLGMLPNPTATQIQNSIMPSYQDVNPTLGGTIEYETIGTAPNRIFVVLYKDMYFFNCTSICNYISVLLYEGSNNIEVHIGDKPICATWNGGLAIQGTENDPGTVAHITPGRNNTVWGANQEGRRWTPTSPAVTTNYTITTEPYILVSSASTSFQWESTNGNTWPYIAPFPVNPVLPGTTGYFLSGSACGASLGSVSDTSWITGVSSQVDASSVDDICSAGQGSVTATPLAGVAPYTFDWTTLGNNTNQTVTGVSAGTHTVIMTDSLGCTSTATVTVGDTPAAFQGSTTLISCPGGNDGTAFAEMIPVLGNVTYLWDDPLAQTTQTAIGLTAGQYTCTVTSDIGCSGTVVLDVTETAGMVGVITAQTDPTCNSGSNGVITVSVTQGMAPYTYSWDNSTSTGPSATDLTVGTHTLTVTDANGCIMTITATLTQPSSLVITSLTPPAQICSEDDITLNVTGSGGSSAYTFTWTQGGNVIGTGPSITVDPLVTNTVYCVELSEACGSPTDQECTTITFPTPIEPMATSDFSELCMPGRFEFTNTSMNAAEIATTYWDFGDQQGASIEVTDDSTSYQYNAVGVYDVILTVTSIYGCIYTDTMKQIVEVKPNPSADFTFSSNPTSVFESEGIKMQDRSSTDVVTWSWFSPYSNPSTSSQTQPTFDFPGVAGIYPVTLVVETALGCFDTITINMNVHNDILFYAPNAFTPDDDELNQTWKAEIQGVDIYDFELFIFNRWGEIIWESHDPSVGWDGTFNGKIVQSGIYQWKANVKDLYTDEKVEFTGSINLLK